MRYLIWLFRGFLFFALFAFALNNHDPVVVRWFFGHAWEAPLVIVVLAAFGLGCAMGVLAMVPAWWKHRRVAVRQTAGVDTVQEPIAPHQAPPAPDGL